MPVYKQQAKHLKVARKAALDGDAAAARRAMLDWARLQWPDDAPRSVGSIAARVSAPLADELQSLSRLSYGPESAPWDGRDFARALRSFAVTDDRQTEDAEALPRLLPATSDRN